MFILYKFLTVTSNVVWGTPMVIFFLFTALRFNLKSRFFQIKCLGTIFRNTLGTIFERKDKEGISPFSAFCSVLGACLGTGNIVGVAAAICSGGPGTVFWMWLSAILSSMTAYAENYLGANYRILKNSKNISGVYAYMEKGLKSKATARLYGVFALISALGTGNMTQSNSLAQALKNGFDVPQYITGIITLVICGIVLWGGINRIARTQTVIVPLMTLAYMVISAMVLYKFRSNILPCVLLIFKEAFSKKSFSGFGIYKASRYGISRGVFSNEAGLGSATLLHSHSNANPKSQGMWAIVEVFIDTVIMCTVTALVILSSKASYTSLYGAELSLAAYSTIGEFCGKLISLLTSVFALTSLISCSFYGEKAVEYLFKKNHTKLYKLIYIIAVFIGCINPPQIVWTLADICNGLMAIPNLYAINCLGNEVRYA